MQLPVRPCELESGGRSDEVAASCTGLARSGVSLPWPPGGPADVKSARTEATARLAYAQPRQTGEEIRLGSDINESEGGGAPTGEGLSPWIPDGEWRHTQVRIGPESCAPGTGRPLTGVLFAYLDVVTGSPPSGAMNPTVDLEIRLFSAPKCGIVRFRARTLRLGRTLYVGEAELRHEDDEEPFAAGVATFVNGPLPFPERGQPDTEQGDHSGVGLSYRPLTGVERVSAGCLQMEADIETVQGTVSGATLGRLVEMSAVDLLSGSDAVVDELEVRFLNRVRVGPLRATADVLGRRDGTTTVRVEVLDLGDGGRLVTYGLALCRPRGGS